MSGFLTKTLISSELPMVSKHMIHQMEAYIFLHSLIQVKQVKTVDPRNCEL